MTDVELSREEIHARLQAQFDPDKMQRFTSTATAAKKAEDVEKMLLPEEERGVMPFTRDDFVIDEDPRRVAWEREVRKFLDRLNHSKGQGHRTDDLRVGDWCQPRRAC